MKNIVILNHHASIPKYFGGGRHHQFAAELSDRNYNVKLISSSYSHATKKYMHKETFSIDNVKENYVYNMIETKPEYGNNTKKRLLNYIDFKNKLKKVKLSKKPNVIIASSVHPFTWISGYKLSKKYNAKFVVEVRDLWPLSLYEDLNKYIRPLLFMYFNFLEKKYYNLASSIIVTAPNAAKYIQEKYGVSKEKIHFIPHSIDVNEFDENTKRIIDKPINKILEDYFCVTYTGSLSKSEGLDNLIYLAERFKGYDEIRFLIIGSGTEKDKINHLIKELKINNVVMFERLPREDIPSILFNSSVLFTGLMDRKAFKYGISKNKFYDYMAAKKPVIFMSNVEDSAIEMSNCGFVIKNHSINEAETRLLELYNDEKLSSRLATNGREYVIKNHTIQTITDKLIKAIL